MKLRIYYIKRNNEKNNYSELMGCIFCPKKKYNNNDINNSHSLSHPLTIVENKENNRDINDESELISEKDIVDKSAETVKNFIKKEFPELDDLFKASLKCEENLAQKEESRCSKIMQMNIQTKSREFMRQCVNNYFDKNKNQLLQIDSKIEKSAMDNAINKIMKTGLDKDKSTKIVRFLMKKYNKEKNFSGKFEVEKEFENIKNITLQFNNGTLDETWQNKMKIIAGDKAIKNTVIHLSLLNISYTIIDIAEKLYKYDELTSEISSRLEKIKRNFDEHKSNVDVLPEDIDAAAQRIQELYKNFKQDHNDIIKLINDINDSINNIQKEKKESFKQLFVSGVKLVVNVGIGFNTTGEERIENFKGGLHEFFNIVDNAKDIVVKKRLISDLKKQFEKANELKEEIEREIEKLKEKYNNLRK